MIENQMTPAVAHEQKPATLERLEDAIGWYNRESQGAQKRYKILKVAQVVVAGLIPLGSAFPIPEAQFKWLTAVLGLLVLIIEAVQQLNQDQQNWIAYRSTCEALKHEKYLHLAGAGPYENGESAEKRVVLLADRVEALISQEHAKWVSTQEQAVARNSGTPMPSASTSQIQKSNPLLRRRR